MRPVERVRRRRSIRRAGYDYAGPGACFVTICTHGRACLFGDVAGGGMRLNAAGRAAEESWRAIPHHFPRVALDAFVVMPNHVHGILWMVDATDPGSVVGRQDAVPAARANIGGDVVSERNVGGDPVGDNVANTVGAKDFVAPTTPI